MTEPEIGWGPCCFCGLDIPSTAVDPCRVQITTSGQKWQVWFCHAACFKERIVNRSDLLGLLDPAHF